MTVSLLRLPAGYDSSMINWVKCLILNLPSVPLRLYCIYQTSLQVYYSISHDSVIKNLLLLASSPQLKPVSFPLHADYHL